MAGFTARAVPAPRLFVGSALVWCVTLIVGEPVAFEIIHDAAYCQPTSWVNSAAAALVAVIIIAASVASSVAHRRQPYAASVHHASGLLVGLFAIGTLGGVFVALLLADTYTALTQGLTPIDVLFAWLWAPSAVSGAVALTARITRGAAVPVQLAVFLVPAICLAAWAAVETVARCG